MTGIRIAVASLLAAAAMLAGGALVQHTAPVGASHRIVVADPIPCCENAVTIK
jgi:hypothetical protein